MNMNKMIILHHLALIKEVAHRSRRFTSIHDDSKQKVLPMYKIFDKDKHTATTTQQPHMSMSKNTSH